MPLRKAGACPEPEPECCLPAPAQGLGSGNPCCGVLWFKPNTARQLVKLFEQLERLRLQQHMQQPLLPMYTMKMS